MPTTSLVNAKLIICFSAVCARMTPLSDKLKIIRSIGSADSVRFDNLIQYVMKPFTLGIVV